MHTEIINMLENLSASTDEPVILTNAPEAWIITVNGVEKFRLEKDNE